MHSSRMRTGRSLTICRSLLPEGGVCSEGCLLPGGVCSWGAVCSQGGLLPGGCLLQGVSASGGYLLLGGVSAPGGLSASGGGVCSRRGVCSQGVCASGGCLLLGGVCSGRCLLQGVLLLGDGIPACTEADTPPPVKRMTDRCKNITLATTSLRPVMTNLLMCFHRRNFATFTQP